MEYGLIGLVILALDIWALLSVWNSGATTGVKIAWTIGIIIFPLVGLLVSQARAEIGRPHSRRSPGPVHSASPGR